MDPNKIANDLTNSNENSNEFPEIKGQVETEAISGNLETPNLLNNVDSMEPPQESVSSLENSLLPGDKVGAGKKLNEDGEIEDSSTKKTLKAVGRATAAYFTGGSSVGKDSQIVNSAPVDKTIGVVSDVLEKVPGVEAVSNELDEAGVSDALNDVFDVIGNAEKGDIAGTVESGKKLLEDKKKLKKYSRKKIIAIISIMVTSILFLVLIVVMICGPVIGGFLDVVESEYDEIGNVENVLGEFVFDDDEQKKTGDIIGGIEDFENLSEDRQNILKAASAAVAAKIPYSYGSHPYAAGLRGIPNAGLDCAGFGQWAYWTGLGGNPGYLTTKAISDRIGTDFIEISPSEVLPGDIGLKRRGGSSGDNYNHTGIYAGNNQWFHAAGGVTRKVVKGNYKGFTIYLRYKGVN